MNSPRATLRLNAECPRCGARPAVQVFREALSDYDEKDPKMPVLSVQCARRKCAYIFTVRAEAFQQAS